MYTKEGGLRFGIMLSGFQSVPFLKRGAGSYNLGFTVGYLANFIGPEFALD